MKIPIPIHPARDYRPFGAKHIAFAIFALPAIGVAAYAITRVILSLPTP